MAAVVQFASALIAVVCATCALAQTPAASSTTKPDVLLGPERLEQLVAPIALHPDTLVAEILMASTYLLEVVEAARWTGKNKTLTGEKLKAAADKQSWDDSIKELTATPAVLAMMNDNLEWTQKLGDAVLAQQADVMDAIQRLRSKALANKTLATTSEQTVSVTPASGGSGSGQGSRTSGSGGQTIAIAPAEPDTIYVPYYDPAVVYGDWPYAEYPPYYFPPEPGYIADEAIASGIAFAAGVAVGAWAANNNYWGGGINWTRNIIDVDRPVRPGSDTHSWSHNPDHRHGVRYDNASVAQRFGQGERRNGAQARLDYRGHSGERVLNPDRPGVNGGDRINRPDGAARDNAKRDAAKRAKTAARPQGKAGNRPAAKQPRRANAFAHVQPLHLAADHVARGRASMAAMGGLGPRTVGMGGHVPRTVGIGGGFHGNGGFRGGGRRR